MIRTTLDGMVCASFTFLKPTVHLMRTSVGCFVILRGDYLTPEVHLHILLIAIERGIRIWITLILSKVKHVHA